MDVAVPAARGQLPAYVARPSVGVGPWPAVVVIHDVFGMTDDLRRQCDWLAGEGFLAIGPNLYAHGRPVTCLRQVFVDLRARRGPTFDDIDSTRRWIVADVDCTGRVGVIGYCMGGAFSILLAPTGDYGASSVNYGRIPDDIDDVLRGSCPVVASYGGRDRGLRRTAAKLETALKAAGVEHDVKEYPDAGHGFLNDHTGLTGTFITVAGRLIGMGPDASAAADARSRIVHFFKAHLDED